MHAGKIHPEMTRAEAEALLPKKPLAPDGLTSDRQTIRRRLHLRCLSTQRMLDERRPVVCELLLDAQLLGFTLDIR